ARRRAEDRRGAHRDRDRPRRRDPGGHGVQLLRAQSSGHRRQHGRVRRGRRRPREARRRVVAGAIASSGRGKRRLGGMNEINVTPLIDVMLVLLVIFMVTAPLLTTGVTVELPKVKSAPMQTDDSKMLVIVTSDEHVYLGKDEITGDVENKLKTNARL